MRDYAALEGHLRSDLGFKGASEPFYRSDMAVPDAFRKALADSFLKKLCPLGSSEEADTAALKKFEAINEAISMESFGFPATNEAESCFWDYFRNNLNTALGDIWVDQDVQITPDDSLTGSSGILTRRKTSKRCNFDLDFIREHMNIGPGAAQRANSSTLATKLFMGEMSWCNSDHLIRIYRSALVETGFWADAEMQRFQKHGFTEVTGGKIFFAKKNAEISRTCCTEANLNMLIQKACGEFIEQRLELFFGISLETQPRLNQTLAKIGSIHGTFGTMDQVSASDSIGLRLYEASMQNCFLKTMMLLSRSESAVLPNGKQVSLHMISTMGNGFTFPLQTIIFASAVRACYQLMGFPEIEQGIRQYGVYGDDIVCRKEIFDFLSSMLTKLGFSVNQEKSFNNGPFRESCGEDYFQGVNIRGVYVKSLETQQQVFSCINRLNRWSARSGIPLPSTVKLLLSWVQWKKFLVPPSESDDAGLKVPFRLTKPRVSSSYWFLYRSYKRKIRKAVMPEPDDSPNPPGWALSFLSGHTSRSTSASNIRFPSTDFVSILVPQKPFGLSEAWISMRDPPDTPGRYKVARKAIPFWDWPGLHQDVTVLSHEAWVGFMMASRDLLDL